MNFDNVNDMSHVDNFAYECRVNWILKGTVTQVLQVEINLNLALRGKNRKGDVFRIFDFGRKHR